MKSVIAEAATISKAVEEAWKKAGNPVEFFTKIVELPKSGFLGLGFGSKNAVIALFFKKETGKKEAPQGQRPEVLKQESYTGFFNNKNLKAENPNKESVKKEASSRNGDQRLQRNQQRRRPTRSTQSNQRRGNNNQGQSQNNKQQERKPARSSSNVKSNSSNNNERRDARPQRANNQQRPNNQQRKSNQGQNQNRTRTNNPDRRKAESGSSSKSDS